jgi:hypothetical protein
LADLPLTGGARSALDVLADVEFQWPRLLDVGVRTDAGDLKQAQRIHPRRQTYGHYPARFSAGWLSHSDDCLEWWQRVKLAFRPWKDVSGPAPALATRRISLEAHQLISAEVKPKISDLKKL